jgi:hypothetical protein
MGGYTMGTTLSTTDHFVGALAEMRAHYLDGATAPFVPADSLHATNFLSSVNAFDDDPPSPDVLAQLDGIHSTAKSDFTALNSSAQDKAQGASTQVSQDKNADAFMAKMQAQRDDAKKASNANIDKAYDAAEKLGIAHPAAQNQIMSTMTAISDAVNGIIGGLVDAVKSIIDAVVKLISGILKPLEAVVEAFEPLAGLLAFL